MVLLTLQPGIVLPEARSNRPLCKRTRLNPIEVAGAEMRRNTDVPVRKDLIGSGDPDANVYFPSATAWHSSVFACPSPKPIVMTRWSASGSGSQSGTYAILQHPQLRTRTRGETEGAFGF